jgi:hypothetical protein
MRFDRILTANKRELVLEAIPHLREIVLLTSAYFIYVYTRAIFFADIETVAFSNAKRIVDLERAGGFFWEQAWQQWALDAADAMVIFFNWVYIFTFFPIIITTAVVLYIANRKRYFFFRNVVLTSFVVALAIFALFPLAPPRMLSELVDTIDVFGPTFYASRELANYYNEFAAMPSLHFAWTLIFGYMFFTWGPVWLKPIGIIYPFITLLAITITGNHYITDAVGGGVVMVSSLIIMYLFERYLARRRSQRAGTANDSVPGGESPSASPS